MYARNFNWKIIVVSGASAGVSENLQTAPRLSTSGRAIDGCPRGTGRRRRREGLLPLRTLDLIALSIPSAEFAEGARCISPSPISGFVPAKPVVRERSRTRRRARYIYIRQPGRESIGRQKKMKQRRKRLLDITQYRRKKRFLSAVPARVI